MSLTFRASQIESNKLIASGSTGTATGAKLLIYPHEADDAISPNQGFIDQSVFNTGSIGTDIFLYVSGGIGKKNVGGSQAISVFGGDLHVSGNLTVDGTYPSGGGGGGGNDYWVSIAPDDIRTTGSIYIDAGAYNGNLIEFDNSGSGATIRVADNTAASLVPGDLNLSLSAGSDFLNGGSVGGTVFISAGNGADGIPGTAAAGGDVSVSAGNGGAGANIFPGLDGGGGGVLILEGGAGGTGTNAGGSGGSVLVGAGSGASDTGSGDGGGGGSVSIAAGTGANATNTGGPGGLFSIGAGDGGDGTDGAPGGGLLIYAGAGGDGNGGVAGLGGSIQIIAGPPGFDNFNNFPTGSGPIIIAGGFHSDIFQDIAGSNMTVGVPFTGGFTFELARIFFNRSADPDYAATNGLPSPAEISDVFFFVSGAIGGKDQPSPTVALFGGDVHISGNLTVDGTYPSGGGGVSYWVSETAGEIFTSASLVNVPSGSVHTQFLSSSTGAEITGSVLVDLSQGPNQSFIISGNLSQYAGPWLDVVDATVTPYSYFTIDPSVGIRANHPDPNVFIKIDPQGAPLSNPEFSVNSGSQKIELYSAGNFFFSTPHPVIQLRATGSYPTGSIAVYDETATPADLNLQIRALKINDDPGVAGYVLTSSGPGVSPGWAAASSGLATGKQYIAPKTTTNSTAALMAGQFSWVPADYTGLTSVRVRAIMSTDGTVNHTGSLQIYNLTSGSYLDLIDTPATSTYFEITSSTPTLVTSSNLLTGITNFDNSSTSVYEVRVSGSTANNTIIGGVELIFS